MPLRAAYSTLGCLVLPCTPNTVIGGNFNSPHDRGRPRLHHSDPLAHPGRISPNNAPPPAHLQTRTPKPPQGPQMAPRGKLCRSPRCLPESAPWLPSWLSRYAFRREFLQHGCSRHNARRGGGICHQWRQLGGSSLRQGGGKASRWWGLKSQRKICLNRARDLDSCGNHNRLALTDL